MSPQTTVKWIREGYGEVDFGEKGQGVALNDQVPSIFLGTAGDQGASQGPDNTSLQADIDELKRRMDKLEKDFRRLAKGVRTVQVHDLRMTDDTDTAALDEWVTLPGVSKTIALVAPATFMVTVQIRVRCDALSVENDATFAARVTCNGDEIGRGIYSHTMNAIAIQGRNEHGTFTVTFVAAVNGDRGHDYSFEVQIANLEAETTFTAETGAVEDTKAEIAVFPRVPERHPARPATHTAYKWLQVAYDGFNDRLIVWRWKGFWYNLGDLETGVPDVSTYQLVAYQFSQLPIVSVLDHSSTLFEWSDPGNDWSGIPSTQMVVRDTDGLIFVMYEGPSDIFLKSISPAGYAVSEASEAVSSLTGVSGFCAPILHGSDLFMTYYHASGVGSGGRKIKVTRRSQGTLGILGSDTLDPGGSYTGAKPLGLIFESSNVTMYYALSSGSGYDRIERAVYTVGTDTFGSGVQVLGSAADLPETSGGGRSVIVFRDSTYAVRTAGADLSTFDGTGADYDATLVADAFADSDRNAVILRDDDTVFAWGSIAVGTAQALLYEVVVP